ncbi:UDP-4-amino-4-deoxy-L-arabinose--oxoglutarate aminotransferase [Achromobacter xylosoxidans]|jgi:dTDP-4-amino-4,6-dideoxygalactose transaminase|uniref:dTDP-4-amino-4,6-dideoxygalactose transaminase n=2 Tax=Alcaligenes xylosoxydans xylosoxydans TaxID=85698 RepID=UPI0006C45A98|nr:dTDP-4-amino-4,6-dideoxygalactose transaminase [Achromobacter xylosoxidans]PNM91671.1 dTDP-4-amino-4,6-dideoxy-D-glucose transaminase [Achromobacter xylosoxidans]CUJ03701.1 UDP-4-amino-4-deoxy-L-arabinose--oxoglutarate aminotransferase [Achromobacter xylosoxidans]
MKNVPFNAVHLTNRELEHIAAAIRSGKLAGDGPYTHKCQEWLQQVTGARRALLTHSCTAALEMAALLSNVAPGDEVIMPSFTFVSTANAFALRGATPVFVDIRPDTLNLDERLLESAITPKTKVIVPVHYAGVACDMTAIMGIARDHRLLVVEDAAQGADAYWQGQPLGTIGDMGALSFHATKNVIAGEGGALLTNDPALAQRAEILREKGTDRSQFLRGEVDRYTWQDVGSSFLPSELIAAFLWSQLEDSRAITAARLAVWNRYHEAFQGAERQGKLTRPTVPEGAQANGHIYYLLLDSAEKRETLRQRLLEAGVGATTHYVSLHDSPAGARIGRCAGTLPVTERVSETLLRLPMFAGLDIQAQDRVIDVVLSAV